MERGGRRSEGGEKEEVGRENDQRLMRKMKRGEEKGERKNRLLNNEERGDGEVRMVAEK